ncbi:phosphatase PAP2 family protein [Candidatus Marsarchaeota archaeon]|nr:phosphatase PAP2 family protein [Candidatus Marsarchaeota archaeon]
MFLLLSAYNIGINMAAFKAALALSSPSLTYIMSMLAKSYYVVLPVLLLYMYFKKDMNVYSFALAGVIFFLISDTMKMLIREPRPCNTSEVLTTLNISKIACESSYAFPSNHATVLTGLTLFIGKYKYIRAAYIVWLIVVLFGRVYLLAHYLTDVIAGIAISLFVGYIIYRYKSRINAFINGILKRIVPPLAVER